MANTTSIIYNNGGMYVTAEGIIIILPKYLDEITLAELSTAATKSNDAWKYLRGFLDSQPEDDADKIEYTMQLHNRTAALVEILTGEKLDLF